MKMIAKQNMDKKNVQPKPYHHQQSNEAVNYLTLNQETTPQHFSPTEIDSSNSQNESTPDNIETINSSNRSDDSCKLIIDDDVESSQDSVNITNHKSH